MVAVKEISEMLLASLNVKVVGDIGAQHTIVLAHGFGCTHSAWDEVLPTLLEYPFQGGVRTIVFDWPGAAAASCTAHFATAAHPRDEHLYYTLSHILVSLLHKLNVSSCTYVGHSMAAMVGCVAALREPTLFQKLILVCASPRYLNTEDYFGGFEEEDLQQLYEAMAGDYRGWAEGFARVVVEAEAEGAVRKFAGSLCGMRPTTALAMAKAVFESDFRGAVDDLMAALQPHGDEKGSGVKVVVLQTRKDKAVPLVVSDYLRQRLGSKGRVEVLQTDGHLPHLSAPGLFSGALLRIILENK